MNLFEQQQNEFATRHIGPDAKETAEMLRAIGEPSIESLIAKTVPAAIRSTSPLNTGGPMSEYEYLKELKQTASLNKVYKTYIGRGYYGTIVPSVILRTVFENPGWMSVAFQKTVLSEITRTLPESERIFVHYQHPAKMPYLTVN